MATVYSRSPQGECGLKSYRIIPIPEDMLSLPARGVWIEIGLCSNSQRGVRSLPARGVWIEIPSYAVNIPDGQSRSPQGECGLK